MRKWGLWLWMLLPGQVWAQSSWNVSVGANSITEAGNNYSTSAVESAANQFLFDIVGGPSTNFTLTVNRLDADWSNLLSVLVRRTGPGAGSGGFIAGGDNYQMVTTLPQTLSFGTFGPSGRRNNIPVQIRLAGISVLVPAKTYTTTLVFTISN